MFKRSLKIRVDLSEELGGRLDNLEQDLVALVGLISDLAQRQRETLETLRGEIAVQVAETAGVPVGLQVFEDETVVANPTLTPAGELPDTMQETTLKRKVADSDRVRTTPFTRSPRHVQVDWLKSVMADGDWYAGNSIAREYATDERHHRYMRGAVTSRLREMHEEGLVERRDSHVRGSMFEYRLKP